MINYNKITAGDILFQIFKYLVFSVEIRHYLLIVLAWSYRFLPWKTYTPQPHTIYFWDGSNPWKIQSPIFLAAGASKNGKGVAHFFNMGFGGVTVGSVTLAPHNGNAHRPRIALLPKDNSIQNSMGLGNIGLHKVVHRLKRFRQHNKNNLLVGLSLTEKPGTKLGNDAKEQIIQSFHLAYNVVDYFEINVSCPNTGSQRIDQYLDFSHDLLQSIAKERLKYKKRKAVFIKISPDIDTKNFHQFLQWIKKYKLTGVVLANTVPLRQPLAIPLKTPWERIKVLHHQGGKGGLSGRCLYSNTLKLTKEAHKVTPSLSIISVGGIDSPHKVKEILQAGASVVQCYSVLAYRWNAVGTMLRDIDNS